MQLLERLFGRSVELQFSLFKDDLTNSCLQGGKLSRGPVCVNLSGANFEENFIPALTLAFKDPNPYASNNSS